MEEEEFLSLSTMAEEEEEEEEDEVALAAVVVEPQSAAEEVAAELSYAFFSEGRYSASIGPVEVPSLISAVSASGTDARQAASGFGAISVQAVGFEEGNDAPSVHVYLTHGTARQIKDLPKEVRGVKVQTHKMGPISVRPEMSGNVTNRGHIFDRNGRICCGTSCAPTSENCSGTLGALVRMDVNGEMYVLSNNHVLAGCNHVPRGQPIMAPSNNDGRPNALAPREIAVHDRIHELRTGNPGMVNPCDADVALALVKDERVLSSWQGDARDGFDTPASTIEPKSMMRVKKFGRTTALTTGIIQAKIGTPTSIDYVSKHFKGVVWFSGIWIIQAVGGVFALPGDSGSLVVTEDGKHAVGLLFAANKQGTYGWIIPMSCVLRAFSGLELVSDHGL